ncbi:MAG: aldehyde ferredoxin oxidoreductase family protein [Proteobacteria bacterium]|nr:aldehyde ferredoxin oxidoreductase family protein [Pseudomonadota bacterium]
MSFTLGNILHVDLGTGKIKAEPADEKVLRQYMGGCGYGAYILAQTLPCPPGPLDPASPLIFSCGPITGTAVPTSGRHTVVARSPLTGIWGEASIGGSWGRELRRAGYLSIVVVGKAPRPTYLWITNDGVELRSAEKVWGQECEESDSMLRAETDPKAVVSTIGPAGERMIAVSGIFTDGEHARAAARCGLGAVAGSKNLKAIVVRGNQTVPVQDSAALKAVTKPLLGTYRVLAKGLGGYGTPNLVHPCADVGTMPFQNWRKGKWEGAEKINGEQLKQRFSKGNFRCAGCPIGCGRKVELDGKIVGGPEYETLALIGGGCLIDDLEALCRLNRRCNQLGIDTMETGSLIGLSMELYERGLISKEDTGGLELTWGSVPAATELVEQIGKGEGLGALLGQGINAVVKEVGGLAGEYAVQVKGMASAAHDPRAYHSIAVGYATSNRGACHLQAFSHAFERNVPMPEWGLNEPADRLEVEGKALLVKRAQDLMGLFDSVAMCKFSLFAGVNPGIMTGWINAITGWDMTPQEIMLCGERIFNLKRLYNNHLGISRKDDTLPGRFLTHKRGEGGTVKSLPPLNIMLSDYYELRGWSEEGIPQPEKVAELGLEQWDVHRPAKVAFG